MSLSRMASPPSYPYRSTDFRSGWTGVVQGLKAEFTFFSLETFMSYVFPYLFFFLVPGHPLPVFIEL